jgi:hypothetical protein
MDKNFTIRSSNGEWKANKQTGGVINYQDRYPLENGKRLILIRFDIQEYKKHYQVTELPDSIDILDLGYYYKERNDLTGYWAPKYEEPAHDWREEVKVLRTQ